MQPAGQESAFEERDDSATGGRTAQVQIRRSSGGFRIGVSRKPLECWIVGLEEGGGEKCRAGDHVVVGLDYSVEACITVACSSGTKPPASHR